MQCQKAFYVILTFLTVFTVQRFLSAYPGKERSLSTNIDFSGVEKFLELTAMLEKDQEPSLEQWNELFSTPGYDVLITREFRKEFFIERFKSLFSGSTNRLPIKKEERLPLFQKKPFALSSRLRNAT